MAKLAVVLRDKKRRKTVEKFKTKRAALIDIIEDSRASDEAREEARAKLQRLPRGAPPGGLRQRRALAGRPPAREIAHPRPAARPAPRRVQQVRPRPQQAARSRPEGRDSRRDQGE